MLKKGDHAVYGMNGVCEITDIEERESGKFYRMVPENDRGLTIFLFVTTDRLRPPTDRKEAEDLLNSIPDMPDIRTDDSKSRRKRFSEIVSCGGLREIMILSGSIFRKKCERRSRGRTMYAFEENQLRSALKAATGELSYSLSISSQQAEEMLEYKFSEN